MRHATVQGFATSTPVADRLSNDLSQECCYLFAAGGTDLDEKIEALKAQASHAPRISRNIANVTLRLVVETSRVGAVMLYTALRAVLRKYRKWLYAALHRQ
jgi:hypothetical protein